MKYVPITVATIALVLFRSYQGFSWGGVIATLLCVGILTYIALRSTASNGELAVSLAGLYFVPGSLINFTEGALFDVIKVADVPDALLRELATSIVFALVIVAAVRGLRPESPVRNTDADGWPLPALLWRVVSGVATFILCYFVAGAIIFPFVREYYNVRVMPPMSAIASMQVLRALALMVVAYPVVRAMPCRKHARIALAIALPVIGGIAPLLPDNPLMPPLVRFVHACEITPYYALYGFLLATWFGRREGRSEEIQTGSASPAVV